FSGLRVRQQTAVQFRRQSGCADIYLERPVENLWPSADEGGMDREQRPPSLGDRRHRVAGRNRRSLSRNECTGAMGNASVAGTEKERPAAIAGSDESESGRARQA